MKTIYVDMVGDLFHRGHVNFLKRVYELEENSKIIVGVMDDKEVEKYKRTPIMSLRDRASVIEVCKYVDEIIAPCPLVITEDFLNKHNIDLVVHAHGEDETKYNFMYQTAIDLGKFKRLDYTEGISTTDIINKCINRETK